MTHQANFLKEVAELYWLLGHKVTRITRRSNTTTDLAIISDRGDSWFVRCEYVRELDPATLERCIRSVKSGNAKQAALIVAGRINPKAMRLPEPETLHLLDGRLFRNYLHRARTSAKSKTNPLVFAVKRIAWNISMQFVSRTYQPFPPEPSQPTRTASNAQPAPAVIVIYPGSQRSAPNPSTPAHASSAPKTHRARVSPYPCPFCQRPFSGTLQAHFQFECLEASEYLSNRPPRSSPRIKPDEAVTRSAKGKWAVVDDEGIVLSFEDYPKY